MSSTSSTQCYAFDNHTPAVPLPTFRIRTLGMALGLCPSGSLRVGVYMAYTRDAYCVHHLHPPSPSSQYGAVVLSISLSDSCFTCSLHCCSLLRSFLFIYIHIFPSYLFSFLPLHIPFARKLKIYDMNEIHTFFHTLCCRSARPHTYYCMWSGTVQRGW